MAVLYSLLPLATFVVSHDFQHLIWAASVLLASFAAEVIKRATQYTGLWPKAAWCRRPQAATDCDTWNRNGPQGGAPGFPSGHVATAAAFWMGAWLLTRSAPLQPYVAAVGILATTMMAIARLKKHCHTVLQTMGGTMLGAAISYIVLEACGTTR